MKEKATFAKEVIEVLHKLEELVKSQTSDGKKCAIILLASEQISENDNTNILSVLGDPKQALEVHKVFTNQKLLTKYIMNNNFFENRKTH